MTNSIKSYQIEYVRKFFIFLLSVSLTSAVAVLSANSVSANHQEDVLGVASSPTMSIPPTSEGPGLVLPDSPLFFLDRLKQEFRLLLAFTPEQKATIHNSIAGERMAELQLMLAKNNIPGIRTALQGVSDNSKGASVDLANAKLTGRNISLLAKEINDSIKEKQKTLSGLEQQSNGEIKAQVRAAKEALKIAKVSVEENLPADLLMNETIDDLNQEISDNINNATGSARGINRAIEVLTRLASEAAVRNQPARQAALIHAIEVKSLVAEFQKASTSLQKDTSAIKDQTVNENNSVNATGLQQKSFLLKLGVVNVIDDLKRSVHLSWAKVPGTAKYNIFLRTGSDDYSKAGVSSTGDISETIGVNNNLDYHFKVQACGSPDDCIDSNEVSLLSEQKQAAQQSFLLKLGVVTPQTDPKANVYLNWADVAGTAKYNIYLRNSKSEEYGATLASTGEPGYTAGVNIHLDNYFIVKACKTATICFTSNEVFLPKQ